MIEKIFTFFLNRNLFLLCLFQNALFSEEKTYVTCMFWGELGNQMFEIANVEAYALEHQCEPIYPSYRTAANGECNYQHVFYRINMMDDQKNIVFYDYHHPAGGYQYAPVPFEPGKSIRMLGHYQNENYFSKYQHHIRWLFSPSDKVLLYIKAKYGEISKENTVGLHVRTFIPAARHPDRDGFGGATWEYFIEAMNYFPEDYVFFVVSDDPAWTKAHFPALTRNIKFIDENPHYIDLYLLSLCGHQIVSPESTFSWWAAWLNSNPNKTVIVPHFWIDGQKGDGIFPADWIQIYTPNKFGY